MPQRSRLAEGLAVTAMLSALAATVPARALAAQTVTVTGTVRADSTTPLAGALVSLDPGGKPAGMRTDASGRFRFEQVPPGQHILSVFASGQTSVQRLVEVADKDLQIDVLMHPRGAQNLDTVTVIAKRTGVYGYVGDLSNMKPLSGAIVQVLGSQMADTTDSAARFDLPKIHDNQSYLVRVSHPGYRDKLVSVSVPKKAGYELGVFLSPTTEKAVNQDLLWREMDRRVHWRGMNAALLTRKDLGTNPRRNLATALQLGAARDRNGMRLTRAADASSADPSYPCIFVNGRFLGRAVVLDMFDVRDVEAVELYGKDTQQWRSQLQPLVPSVMPACGVAATRYTTDGVVGHYVATPAAAMAEARQQIVAIVIWLKR